MVDMAPMNGELICSMYLGLQRAFQRVFRGGIGAHVFLTDGDGKGISNQKVVTKWLTSPKFCRRESWT